jgi:type VI secretion system secreted protein VgrG
MTSIEVSHENRHLALEVASGDALDVRQFSVEERMSALFEVRLVVLSESAGLDFDAIVGGPARFSLRTGGLERSWSGLVARLEQVGVEEKGLSTYELTLVPVAWLGTQRRNHRMFQQITEPDIVLSLLAEWNVAVAERIDRAAYKKRKYRVQYGESDHAFLSRMLEDAGICYFFEDHGGETRMILADAPHAAARRAGALTYVDRPNPGMAPVEFVTALRIGQRIRPGKYTMRDRDYRLPPAYPLAASATAKGRGVEERLERFHYTPGAFLFGTDKGEVTPAADDKGKTRSDEGEAAKLSQKRLEAKRGSAKNCSFTTNAHDLAPGMVIDIGGHPHPMLGAGRTLLLVASKLEGTSFGEWRHELEARSTEVPYRPALTTAKPKVNGVESGTVVGPADEEIHVDEFGRVRVHFHWDRESRMDDASSCWVPVSEAWGGATYGGVNLPRIGQEVLVDFLGGDPDRPIVVGRVFTNLQKVPYKLPDHKTRSAWKSNSTGQTGGFNEIMFEDLQGRELVFEQAERNRRRLVKNDETITVGNDRDKLVKGHELETTHLTRTEVTGIDRTELTAANRTTVVGGNRQTLVQGNDAERVGASRQHTVGGSLDMVVGGSRRTNVGGSEHLTVTGGFAGHVNGGHSMIVGGDAHERVFGRYAMETDGEIHLKGKKKVVIEVGEDFCIKGPGGFIRINAEGVIIKGATVKINSGGTATSGSGVQATMPDSAGAAIVEEPPAPLPDDVSRTGIGQ